MPPPLVHKPTTWLALSSMQHLSVSPPPTSSYSHINPHIPGNFSQLAKRRRAPRDPQRSHQTGDVSPVSSTWSFPLVWSVCHLDVPVLRNAPQNLTSGTLDRGFPMWPVSFKKWQCRKSLSLIFPYVICRI